MSSDVIRGQWQRIEHELAEDIADGRFADTMQLPTETELMQRFNVGRHSVRRAISELESRGLVDIRHGKGTFLREGLLDYRLSERTRFSQNLLGQGREPFTRVLQEAEVKAPAHVSGALRLPADEPVYHIVRCGFADEEMINFSNAYYSVRRFPGLNEARRAGRSMSAVLSDYGVTDYIRLRTDLFARMPTAEEARQLSQPRTEPVFVTRKIDVDMKGVPIVYSESVWPSQRVQFSIDNTAELLDVLARAEPAS
jgi:GntR family transcriptional regulator, phosphonate transport system regulatory protein